MKPIYSVLRWVVVLFAVAAISCNDEFPVNRQALTVHFEYTMHNHGGDRFSQDVNKMTVYAFDENGIFIDEFTEEGAVLHADDSMVLPLEGGNTYTVAMLGGTMQNYKLVRKLPSGSYEDGGPIKGVTHYSEVYVIIDSYEENGVEVAKEPTPLWYNMIKDIVTDARSSTTVTSSLKKNTSTVSIRVEEEGGNSDTRSELTYEASITAYNSFDYNNMIPSDSRQLKYVPVQPERSETHYVADIRLMRLRIAKPFSLDIFDPESDFSIHENLVELIMENPKYKNQNDLDREDRFEILVKVKRDTGEIIVGVEIYVNGWKIEHIDPAV